MKIDRIAIATETVRSFQRDHVSRIFLVPLFSRDSVLNSVGDILFEMKIALLAALIGAARGHTMGMCTMTSLTIPNRAVVMVRTQTTSPGSACVIDAAPVSIDTVHFSPHAASLTSTEKSREKRR